MKKRFLAVVMCVCLGISIAGCGKESDSKEDSTKAEGKEENSTTNDLSSVVPSEPAYKEEDLIDDSGEVKALDYVELASYIGLELTKEITEVTDEDVQTEMEKAKVAIKEENAIVADKDTAVIDFTGKHEGVAFQGGTGTDYELVIGSNTFISGFEDGLIGVKKGETVDLNLTFPENYKNGELAGKDVVFTVTVKDVKRKPELTDEWFQTNTEYAGLEEYKTQVRQRLETEADSDAQYILETNALNTVVENSKVNKYFKSFVEEGEKQYENYLLTYASYYNMGLSEFLAANNMSEDDYANTKSKQGASYAQVAMIVDAIAEDAKLTTEDEEYQNLLADLASEYNMDIDGLNTFYGEKMVYTSVMSEYVMKHLVNNANVTTKTVSEDETN
ncbi:MAG: trigger factor [Lachnospiraceae bacterium]|jgi:trigger factor|nr:trigger factor [Lachnospiraceae bacterium]MCI8824969.1 trigger factor [Lachnospiraceae bacterium]MCI9370300.1 trigger factor [Lachnospiraceae bacterium]